MKLGGNVTGSMGRQRQGDETGRSKERIAYERFHGLTSMSVTVT
jgi:hypothetical protein